MISLGVPETAGIGGVALGFGTLVWWIFNRVIEVVEKNAEASARLSNTVGNLEKSIQANTEMTRTTKDLFSSALVQILTKK